MKSNKSKVFLFILIEVLLGIIFSVSSLFFFIKLRSEVFEKEFLSFDTGIINFIYNFRTPLLNKIMIGVSYLGSQFIIAAAIILVVIFFLKNHKKDAALFIFIISMAFIINNILKEIIQRPRPQIYPLISASGYSFPSGHAMDSFVFYATFSYLVFHFTQNKKLGFISTFVSITIILLIGISRVYLGVHYPTDVLAGYLGGFFWFISVILIEKTLIFFRLFREIRS